MIIAIALSAALSVLVAGDPVVASPSAAATPAVASNASPYNAPAAQPKSVADANKVTCRSEESTGSRLGGMRVCMTNAQWQHRGDSDRQVLQVEQNRSFTH